jgi:tellurite resistance protein
MEIDTQIVRNLRDTLIENGRLKHAETGSGDAPNSRARASIERVKPFAETMCLMMMVDGVADEAEKDAIRGALEVLTDGLLHATLLDDMLEECLSVIRDDAFEARLQMIGTQLSGDKVDRETAFMLAAAVAAADQAFLEREMNLLDTIAEWYGLSSKRTAQLLNQLENG